jgi:proprotein convertase subtilisin/kexin type 5
LITECQACIVDGYYHDGVSTCKTCDASCTKCTGPLISECSECKSTHFLSITTCTACDVSCVGCTGLGNGNCKACSTSGT